MGKMIIAIVWLFISAMVCACSTRFAIDCADEDVHKRGYAVVAVYSFLGAVLGIAIMLHLMELGIH